MRKTTRTLLTLGLAAMTVMSSFVTAFAYTNPFETEPGIRIYGQRPEVRFSGSYTVVIVGDADLQPEDVQLVDGYSFYNEPAWGKLPEAVYYNNEWAIPFASEAFSLLIDDSAPADVPEPDFIQLNPSITIDGMTHIGTINIVKLPDGVDPAELGENQKYVIYANGTGNAASEADTGAWASNENGWWIQFKDGSYLTSAWWQSPDSGLWYYMGADGYMVTNTVVDNRTINADGVWVQ